MTTSADIKAELPTTADMLAKASSETGLNDFGDAEFHDALTHLVDSVTQDKLFNAFGIAAFGGDMHRVLVNRLRMIDDLKRHPEIEQEFVDDPIVIIGLPRTGTTKLQRMLSADPGVQRLDYWRLMNVAPFPGFTPGASGGKEDPRIEAARQAVNMIGAVMPDFMAIHPTGAEEVDEDCFFQHYTLKAMVLYIAYPSISYWNWLQTQSQRGSYRFLKQSLQYMQWQDGGRRDRPWVLKSPVHIGTLDLLMEQFPKATLVFPHRRLDKIIPSLCRLMEARTIFLNPPFNDQKYIGQMIVQQWSGEMRKHLALRERLGASLPIMDVQYEDIAADPTSVIRAIYRQAGRELTPARAQAMLDWEQAHPQHHAGSYSYTLEDYGLTREGLNEAFAEYVRKFKM